MSQSPRDVSCSGAAVCCFFGLLHSSVPFFAVCLLQRSFSRSLSCRMNPRLGHTDGRAAWSIARASPRPRPRVSIRCAARRVVERLCPA